MNLCFEEVDFDFDFDFDDEFDFNWLFFLLGILDTELWGDNERLFESFDKISIIGPGSPKVSGVIVTSFKFKVESLMINEDSSFVVEKFDIIEVLRLWLELNFFDSRENSEEDRLWDCTLINGVLNFLVLLDSVDKEFKSFWDFEVLLSFDSLEEMKDIVDVEVEEEFGDWLWEWIWEWIVNGDSSWEEIS